MEPVDLEPLAAMIENRRRLLQGIGDEDMPMGNYLLSFNLGRLAGHTSFTLRHAKADDRLVFNCTAMAKHFKHLRGCLQLSPVKCDTMRAATRKLNRSTAKVGDLWIDEPAWCGTSQELGALLNAWRARRKPDALAITMGGIYIAPL